MSGRNDSFICYLPNFSPIPQHHRQMPEYQSSQWQPYHHLWSLFRVKDIFLRCTYPGRVSHEISCNMDDPNAYFLFKRLFMCLLACLFICCVCVCVWCMHMCTCMCMTKCTCGGQRITLGLRPCIPAFWKQVFFVFSVGGHILGLLVVKFLGGFSCLCLPFHCSKSETTDVHDYAKLEIWT